MLGALHASRGCRTALKFVLSAYDGLSPPLAVNITVHHSHHSLHSRCHSQLWYFKLGIPGGYVYELLLNLVLIVAIRYLKYVDAYTGTSTRVRVHGIDAP